MARLFFLFLFASYGLAATLQSQVHATPTSLQQLEQAAEGGDAHAAQQLYMRYAIDGKTDEAHKWAQRYNELLEQKAKDGDVPSMLVLGARYLRGGDYTPVDVAKATEWFSRAAEKGDPTAAYMLGEIYTKAGNPGMAQQSYARAYSIYSSRADAHPDPAALYWLGYMEQNGIGTKKNAESGIAKLLRASELGSAWADAQLFKTYYNGLGTPRDVARAIQFASRLAEQHNDAQMAYVAACAFLFGRGVEKNIPRGEELLARAVRGNLPDAIYMQEERLEQAGRTTEALPLLRQAASMHQREAMVKLGLMMLRRTADVDQDVERALSVLEKAASLHQSPRAAWELARYYDEAGEQELADSWYVVASDRGVPAAMARRGWLHLIPGSCVTWDPTRAYQWWRAGKQGGDPSCSLLVNLFLYAFIPLIIILVFGIPALLAARRHRLLVGLSDEDKSNSH